MLTDKFWDKYFATYDILNELYPYQDLLDRFVHHGKVRPGMRVLDAGAGTGNLTKKLCEAGAEVDAIDISRAGLKRLAEKVSSARTHLGSLCETLPYGDKTFDLVVTNNVIYAIHPQNRASIAKEFFRVLKPGGIVLLANIAPGFKPLNIYREHVREEVKRRGVLSTALRVFRFLPATLKMFLYNARIKREHKGGRYAFMDEAAQERFLRDGGFTEITHLGRVYAGQAVMHAGTKK